MAGQNFKWCLEMYLFMLCRLVRLIGAWVAAAKGITNVVSTLILP